MAITRLFCLSVITALMVQDLAFAAPLQNTDPIASIENARVVLLPLGCEKPGTFGFKKKVDCYGIVLKGVRVRSASNAKFLIGDVLLVPVSDNKTDAENFAQGLIDGYKGALVKGYEVRVSHLRYYDKTFDLSTLTQNPFDEGPVLAGGLDVQILISLEGKVTSRLEGRLGL